MSLIHRLEALFWILFGAGGFVAAFFLPGLIIGIGLLAPLGIIESGVSHERMYALCSSPLGKIFLIAVISLVMWHCAHHIRHFGLDVGMGQTLPSLAAYGVALAGTVATVVVVGGL